METTIYDVHGKPRIYIRKSDNSIYTWDGHAVAYLDGENLYGWKGKHLGWFINNIIYDYQGYRIGFTALTCPVGLHSEPGKFYKHDQHEKHYQQSARFRPSLKFSNSGQDLLDFIKQNSP